MGAAVGWASGGKTGPRAPPWHEVRITWRRLFASGRLGVAESCHLVRKGEKKGRAGKRLHL